ncbi:M90 family metallopeptidase [Flavicella sediminum]|uniref:M90 family metallopeptidase n=1 Tax=Flavicella sediminum TaxID=2585141 RepID=UPI0011223020|nr:M90 family metallopeptidase [Flavicella sediminum]
MLAILVFLVILICVVVFNRSKNKGTLNGSTKKVPKKDFPVTWRLVLEQNVIFYTALISSEKKEFEYKVQEFLLYCRITGIRTSIDDADKVLVAASAVIPIFGFKNWRYTNINEVLIYPNSFNRDFETEGEDRRILGMVGNGYLEGKMILSKEALWHGFKNESDKKNTAIHEFVHLLDKLDGAIDGIPSVLLEKQYAIPWLDLINKKIDEIYEGASDINPYGGTNKAEFFSVTSEYFFERPKLLAKKHPELYALLEKIFNQEMDEKALEKNTVSIGRNSKCPCNSGEKFKKCCGFVHYNLKS